MERFVVRGADVASEGMTLRGYAAVYNQPTTRQRDYRGTESISRGAFDGLLEADVLALRDHDPTKILGRTASGTLTLSSDAHGLGFRLDLPDTELGRDTATLVARGDLRGMSFGAVVGAVERTKGGVTHRSFKRLVDVSIVSVPAYEGTEVSLRHAADLAVREQLIRARARVLGRD